MTDIVERLRHRARVGDGWTRPDAAEAADEIERLRADVAEAIDQRNAADFVLASALKMSERRSVERDAARAEAARLREALNDAEKVMRRVQDWGNARDTELADLTYQKVRAALAKEPGHE